MALADVNIRVGADITKFSTGMQNVSRTMKKVGNQMKSIGSTMSMAVTAPLALIATKGVMAWDKQAKAIAQVEQGLKTTGNTVGFTSDQLQKMASDLQNKTIFGDEEILKNATAQLLTFTSITGEQFDRTQKAALDLATRLDGDLKSASIQLGKALNDPVANLSALSRSGIQFSAAQKEMINSLVASNRLADAQTIILDELNKQYGGSAEAATAGAGALQQLGNAWGDITEEVGKMTLEMLAPFIERLKQAVAWIQALSPEVKKAAFIIGALAAAAGPLLFIFGTLATSIAAISGPVLLVGVAVGATVALIIANWDKIRSYFTKGKGSAVFEDLKKTTLRAWETLKEAFKIGIDFVMELWDRFGGIIVNSLVVTWNFVISIITKVLDNIVNTFRIFKGIFTGDWELVWDSIKNIAANVVNAVIDIVVFMAEKILDVVAIASKAFGISTKYVEKFRSKVNELADGLKIDVPAGAKEAANAIEKLATVADKVSAPSGGGGKTILGVGNPEDQLKKTEEYYKQQQLLLEQALLKKQMSEYEYTRKSTQLELRRIEAIKQFHKKDSSEFIALQNEKIRVQQEATAVSVEGAQKMTSAMEAMNAKHAESIAQARAYGEAMAAPSQAILQFAESASQAIKSAATDIISGFAEMTGAALAGAGGFEKLPAMILSTLGGLATQVGKMAIGVGIAMAQIKISLKTLGAAGAIAAGVALVALGAAVSSGASKLAGGMGGGGGLSSGISSGGGGGSPATSSSGIARDINSGKTSNQVEVIGKVTLKGQDMIIAFEKANASNRRVT